MNTLYLHMTRINKTLVQKKFHILIAGPSDPDSFFRYLLSWPKILCRALVLNGWQRF